jgi:hypothetical protein
LSSQTSPTLQSVQTALKQPLDKVGVANYHRLCPAELAGHAANGADNGASAGHSQSGFLHRAERTSGVLEARNIQPIYSPLFAIIESVKNLSTRPGLFWSRCLLPSPLSGWLSKESLAGGVFIKDFHRYF